MSSNYQNSPCQFAEQIVSYLYDEFERGEKIKFEAHLNDCRMCADELAGFGFVRSAVLEWRDADFSKLAAPSFAVPMNESRVSATVVSTEPRSWFDGIKNLFSFNPAFAATALAVAVVGIGIGLFAFSFSTDKETAGKSTEKDLVKATVSPTVEPPKKSEDKTDIKTADKSSPSSDAENSPKEPNRVKPVPPEKTVVKVSTIAPKNAANNPVAAPNELTNKKPSSAKKQKVPNLNELDEDEDDTIRLADLFDELDTK